MIEVLPNSFVFEKHHAIPLSLCEEMIELFESEPEYQQEGRVIGAGPGGEVNHDIKVSIDLKVDASKSEAWANIDNALFKSLNEASDSLSQQYEAILDGSSKGTGDVGYQIQKTPVNGFYNYHADSNGDHLDRFMVAIWYLNNGFQGGETQFMHQNIKVRPEAGKLVMFPPWWTHWHRGCPVLHGNKYIATTWLNYIGENKLNGLLA
jgi:hypothetical protein